MPYILNEQRISEKHDSRNNTLQHILRNRDTLMPFQSPLAPPELSIPVSADPTECRVVIDAMVKALTEGPRSRPRSLAVTKLEEASMWLNEALRIE